MVTKGQNRQIMEMRFRSQCRHQVASPMKKEEEEEEKI
jgi:hypothetical protein